MEFQESCDWRQFLAADDHISLCQFCQKHILQAMYKRYRY